MFLILMVQWLCLYVVRLFLPDAFVVSGIVKAKEDIRVLADTVVREALQIQGEVVCHGDTARIAMTLGPGVSLKEAINSDSSAQQLVVLRNEIGGNGD